MVSDCYDIVFAFMRGMRVKRVNRYLRVKEIDWSLVDLKESGVILDVGAGTSIDAIRFALYGADVISLDVEGGILKEAQLLVKNLVPHLRHKISFIVADALHLPFKSEAVDVCVSFSVIEHLKHDHQKLIDELSRVTKTNGAVILTTSNKLNLPLRLFRFPLPAGPYSEYKLFSPLELGNMMENAGLKLQVFNAGIVYYWGYGPPLFASSRLAYWLDLFMDKFKERLKVFGGRMGYRAVKKEQAQERSNTQHRHHTGLRVSGRYG